MGFGQLWRLRPSLADHSWPMANWFIETQDQLSRARACHRPPKNPGSFHLRASAPIFRVILLPDMFFFEAGCVVHKNVWPSRRRRRRRHRRQLGQGRPGLELTAFRGFLNELEVDDGGPEDVLPFLESISRLAAILAQTNTRTVPNWISVSHVETLGTWFHRWEPPPTDVGNFEWLIDVASRQPTVM